MVASKLTEYALIIMLLVLVFGMFTMMERVTDCDSDSGDDSDTKPVENFINKNNVGTSYGRFETGIVQGGGGYPFVY